MNKSYILVAGVLLGIVTGGIALSVLKKDLPYDFEVVPMEQGLRVVNTTTWADKDCIIRIEGGSAIKTVDLPAKSKVAEIKGLENGKTYALTVSRKDLLGKIRYRSAKLTGIPHGIDKYVVLFGASIGKAWDLRELDKRKNTNNVFWGYRGYYEFDKTPLVKSVINSPVKPDVVVIKECAAYFPRDTQKSVENVLADIKALKQHGIDVVLATTVPVTKERTARNPEQLHSLNAFNKALRSLAQKQGLPLIDLQAALSESSDEGYLATKFAAEDGLHLQPMTYEKVLDSLIVDFFALNNKEESKK